MIRHYFGFALFSFIVGTSAVVYAMFNVENVVEIAAPSYSATYSPTKSCWKMKRESRRGNLYSPMVKQAVFNSNSKQLRWELDTAELETAIALNFFVKDENGMRYINSELVPMNAYRYDSIIRSTSSYEWLDNLDSYENLYMTAEPISQSAYRHKNFPIDFDASKATAVLLH
jgi:hypothetical protein